MTIIKKGKEFKMKSLIDNGGICHNWLLVWKLIFNETDNKE